MRLLWRSTRQRREYKKKQRYAKVRLYASGVGSINHRTAWSQFILSSRRTRGSASLLPRNHRGGFVLMLRSPLETFGSEARISYFCFRAMFPESQGQCPSQNLTLHQRLPHILD